MSNTTIPVFIVGTGRCGTRMVYKLLSGIPQIEAHHQYLYSHIQPSAAQYYMGVLDKGAMKKKLMETHGAAIFYSNAQRWVDSSNKLSWVIEPSHELFKRAKFVHLIRDGRKVVSSFFHKLPHKLYDDVSVKKMQEWLVNRKDIPKPPPEERYWWNIPQKGQPFVKEFPHFNQFQRICYHWVEANRVITKSLKRIPQKQKHVVKLEDLTAKKDVLKKFLAFFDVEYADHFFEYVQKPQNVIFPMDFKLTREERRQFQEIAQETMIKLGYTKKDAYELTY